MDISPVTEMLKETHNETDSGEALSTANISKNKLMGYAAILMAHRDFSLAIPVLRQVLQISSHESDAIEWLGRCLMETGCLLEAKKVLSELTRLRPDFQSFAVLGQVLYLLEEDEKAKQAYLQAMEFGPTENESVFEVFKNLGNIYTRLGDFEQAEDFFNRAYRLNPQSDVLQVNYGTLAIQKDQMDTSLGHFRAAIAINPKNDRAWVGLGLVHRQMGDHDLAWGNLQKALDLQPKNRTAIRVACDWATQDHRLVDVVECLYQYCYLCSDDVEMIFRLAITLAQVNRIREARWQVERILAMDPEFPQAEALLNELARL